MTIKEMIEIKELRGYSYRVLSEYSGVPVVTIQKIFSGETKSPRRVTLDALEKVLAGSQEEYQGKSYQYSTDAITPSELKESDMIYGSSARNQNEKESKDDSGEFKEKKQGTYTVEDYYKIPDERRVELIDGVIYDMSAPTTVHQDIAFQIHMSFHNYIHEKKKPCKVYSSPVDVQIDCDNKTMLQPDVLVICKREKIQLKKIFGAPDFALEVLSPSTRKKDMSIKLAKYLDSGVREYWIIDPAKKLLIKYDFTVEEFFPEIHSLDEKVPVSISGGELVIDLLPIKEAIEEFED